MGLSHTQNTDGTAFTGLHKEISDGGAAGYAEHVRRAQNDGDPKATDDHRVKALKRISCLVTDSHATYQCTVRVLTVSVSVDASGADTTSWTIAELTSGSGGGEIGEKITLCTATLPDANVLRADHQHGARVPAEFYAPPGRL